MNIHTSYIFKKKSLSPTLLPLSFSLLPFLPFLSPFLPPYLSPPSLPLS